MIKRVNVLCAAPNGPNPGMATVDLAFHDVIAPHLDAEITYWRLVDQSEWLEPPGGSRRTPDGSFVDDDTGMTYRGLRGHLDEFLAGDAVVYWGDFLHMAVYQRQVAHVLRERCRIVDGVEASERYARRHLLLSETPASSLARVVTYGTTLGFNTADDYRSGYGDEARRFFRGVHRAWLRDPYSAFVASTFRSASDPAIKAPDAAFLLPTRPLARLDAGGRLGVFIGRSNLDPLWTGTWGAALESRLGLAAEWIGWGHSPGFWPMRQRKQFRLAWPSLAGMGSGFLGTARAARAALRGSELSDDSRPTRELLDQIAGCALVLTDTYHLAVNAWRLGVPTVCLVDEPSGAWSVNSGEAGSPRDKRVDLYSQLEVSPLIVGSQEVARTPRRTLDRVTDFLDYGLAAVATERIGATREAAVSDVRTTLTALIAG